MHIVGCQAFCSVDHWIENQVKNKDKLAKKGRKIQAKAERDERKAKKEKVKTLSEWLKDAQYWFNRYIRLRDKDEPCISCQRHHDGQYHAGHYRTTKAASQLRFNEDNCHKQCAPCNNHLSGNIGEYRINLIKKIGIDKVDDIESNQDARRYTIDECKELIATYKRKCKELE